ncbi:DNA replication and checkpoint protein, partial [Rhizoctonia solani AG-3 Rhs1AP]
MTPTMSTDIAKIKVEIKEWQRAYRRTHGRDPGKDELRKNPEMQAKYKLWQDSLKAPSRKQDDEASTPPRPSRSLFPKAMPVPSASKAPATPFSARKHQVVKKASSSSDERIAAPDLSSAKRATSSRVIPSTRPNHKHGRFPRSPDPVSPTRSRRASPSKSTLLQTPSKLRSSSPETLPFLTPRTKARKRMRGEEVPATPGDKRRKLGAARSMLPTQDEQDEEDDDEIVDSPRKKRVTGANGRVFTGLFDDDGTGDNEDAYSVMDETSSFRSTPPPPPSEPDHDWTSTHSHSDHEDEPVSRPKARPVLPTVGKWTHDTWDAPALGSLQTGPGKPFPEPTKQKQKQKPKDKDKQPTLAVSNPFDLLPPMPEEQPASSKSREKGKEKQVEVDEGESSDGTGGLNVNEIEWKPFGPLMSSQPQPQPQPSDAPRPEPLDDDEPDLATSLPSDLRTLLSLHSTHREFLRSDSLAQDVLAGRSVPVRGGEVWGVGDVEDEEQGEGDDWDSEPEGWTGGVEM